MTAETTLTAFAPSVPISVPLRVFSALRAATWVQLVNDNPLTWSWRQGRRNERADMEGPLYVPGAPDRMLEPGKAVLATVSELQQYKPFLLSITVRSPHGDPLPRATVDFWQATTAGVYAYRSYGLRGRLTTDAHGTVEVLTVAPGDYGAAAAVRTGHFHMFLQDADGLCECLTTQLYVCHGNDVRGMNKDFLNWVRKSRPQNMLRAWSVPASNDGEPFFEFPELPTDDVDTLKRVEWWNAKLAEQAPDAGLKVVAGGRTEIRLNEKPGWIM
ncbi:catechol 1,2-dioxygenase [Phanerochaete sordida]|uniref:Catechol 1,2-dioxygenase n=1 Tax=Phanerochaete sordida TaxID=48140 RepID=A0A9P3G774_9APHY|nr:catechol 1,2-dioxygenase [Phanerochaete sordida]